MHMSSKRACHRVEERRYIWPCIHMQIPIDMTTFTYCIFALGHILARQFPIVGFRPPVRLIDIIGRAADTRLHFYLHTFANQFEPNRSSVLARTTVPPSSCPCPGVFRFPLLCRRLANDFRSAVEPFAVIRVSYFSMRECAQGAGATSIYAGDLAGAAISPGGGGAICYAFFRDCYLGIHRGFFFFDRMNLNKRVST